MTTRPEFEATVSFIKSLYPDNSFIPLHTPHFRGNEKKYLNECIESTFVSSVGKFVDTFEEKICQITQSKHAVAVVNGSAALHMALKASGVKEGDLVITQALTFVATANSIVYCNASPSFIDIESTGLGMCPKSLKRFIDKECYPKGRELWHKGTERRIAACLPVHIFGHPCNMEAILEICDSAAIAVIEDSTESLGSKRKRRHTGTFGKAGVFSFNGNKIVSSGGGGVLVTDDENMAAYAKHLTTTAKIPHKWEYFHDEVGYNYRLPNINAALACAQLEQLNNILENKRETARAYCDFFEQQKMRFLKEPEDSLSNYWLNAIILEDKKERDEFLEYTNENGVMTRPCWTLLNKLPMFSQCPHSALPNSNEMESRIVNLPSSYRNTQVN